MVLINLRAWDETSIEKTTWKYGDVWHFRDVYDLDGGPVGMAYVCPISKSEQGKHRHWTVFKEPIDANGWIFDEHGSPLNSPDLQTNCGWCGRIHRGRWENVSTTYEEATNYGNR